MMRGAPALLAVTLLLAACASAQKQHADGYVTRRALAQELIRRADYAGAFPIVNSLYREDPQDPEVLVMRAVIYREQKNYPEAQADLQEAVQIAPKYAYAHSCLAIVLEQQGDYTNGLEEHKRAAELEPTNPGYANNMGVALMAQRHVREAIPVFLQALRLDPTSARTRNNLGFAYALTGDYARAAEQFARAGTPAQSKNNLGFAYQAAGQMAQAYDLYVEALRLDPTMTQARKNLAEVAKRLGRPIPGDLAAPPGS